MSEIQIASFCSSTAVIERHIELVRRIELKRRIEAEAFTGITNL
jgi:hypothetical protein